MDNPLLAMLKQASTAPPPQPAATQREATMSPPAQLQPVSLDDLFKSMTPAASRQVSNANSGADSNANAGHQSYGMYPVQVAPPSSYGAHAAPMPIGSGAPNHAQSGSASGPGLATSPPAHHQAKLLGMLSLGKPPSGQSSAADSRPPSGVTVGSSSSVDERKNSLLNVLKSPSAVPASLGEPVITHPHAITPPGVVSPGVIAPPSAGVVSPRGSVGGVTSPYLGPAPAGNAPLVSPPLQPVSNTAVNVPKSIFDFVSPFDAFEPKPRQLSTSQSHSGPQSAAASGPVTTAGNSGVASPVNDASRAAGSSPVRGVVSPPVVPGVSSPAAAAGAVSPVPAASPSMPAPPAVPSPVSLSQVRSNSPAVRQVSVAREQGRKSFGGSPPTAKGKQDLGLPWLVNTVVKNAEGTGPLSLPPGPITIDLSKPGLESLMNTPGNIEITPTTIMKAENVAFQRGRTVAATKGWLAYSLSRGRVRLIDRASGARTMIQLDATGPVIDLTAADEALAVVASDGSVSVFTVPASWSRDDPPCPLIFTMGPITPDLVPADKALGDINHIEFVRRQGTDKPSLAIGGTEGVVIVHPHDWAGSPQADAREVLTSSKVLKTTGVVAAFCLNATHQAIGLLSSSGYFSLYSVVNLNRVWNRQLPQSSPLPLSSVCFCETNIVVGRGNNTHFDLIQITVEIAILTTIKFIAVSPSPPALHFAHAAYSSEREALIITPFARGSAYAFHYALKGQPPQRNVMKDNSHVVAFDSMAELPLDAPILSFVLGSADGDVELFYSTPNGISQATIDKAALVTKHQPEVKPKQAEKKNAKKNKQQQQAAAQAQAAPALAPAPAVASAVSPRAPVHNLSREITSESAATSSNAAAAATPVTTTQAPVVAGITSDELAKALKKTEDKLSSSFKQVVANEMKAVSSRLDKDKDLAATISSAISAHLDAHLAGIVQQELKRIPIEAQIHRAVSEQSSTLGRELERAIAPIVPRTIATVVQPAVERAARDAVEVVLVPAVMQATNGVYDQLAEDLKTEMLQIRKDVNNDQGDALNATNAMLRSMATSISELQKQVAELSAQLQRQRSATPAPVPPAPASIMSPPTTQHHATSMPPSGPPLPSPQALEDTFLHVLQQGTAAAMLQLVSSQAQHFEAILPQPPAKSPLPQAVLLPLIHRLASTLGELPPHHPAFQTTATWLRRAADLVDPRDPSIANYYPRAIPAVEHTLQGVVDRFQSMGPDPLVAAHINVLRQTLEVLKAKNAHGRYGA